MFDPAFPIEKIKGADYNPRRITPDSFERLRASFREIGVVKPVILTEDGTLMAGHQRTKAGRAEGRTTMPAFVLKRLLLGQEMRFNQLHNGADVEDGIDVRVPPSRVEGFVDVSPHDVQCPDRSRGARRRHEVFLLVQRYGCWGSVVATQSGEVLTSQHYAIATKLAAKPCRVYYVPDAKRDAVLHYFGQEYGAFCYDELPRNPWVQAYAQIGRIRNGKLSDSLYERYVRPETSIGERILDFGCGQGELLADMVKRGHTGFGIEFYKRGAVDDKIRPTLVHAMIDAAAAELETRGLFDVVVCDAVLNSVDTVQAETDVLTCVNSFCRPGGRIYLLGLSAEGYFTDASDTAANKVNKRQVEFIDGDGFSASPRGDKWFFQKFHTKEQAQEIARRYIGPAAKVTYSAQGTWTARGVKTETIAAEQVRASLEREFNLPWPGGRTVGRSARMLEAYSRAVELSAKTL